MLARFQSTPELALLTAHSVDLLGQLFNQQPHCISIINSYGSSVAGS